MKLLPLRFARLGPRPVVLAVVDAMGRPAPVVCRTLRAEGYGTVEASHGAEALEIMEKLPEPADLVVTDVVMPGMDGRELGRRPDPELAGHPHPLYLGLRRQRHLPARLSWTSARPFFKAILSPREASSNSVPKSCCGNSSR